MRTESLPKNSNTIVGTEWITVANNEARFRFEMQ